MTEPFGGRAAEIENALPSSKTISGATNASPIVVTTTTPHGLSVGELFTVGGVTGNTAANASVWAALAVTSDTVSLGFYPGGGNSTGNGAYAGGGFLESLGFGTTIPIPEGSDQPRATLWSIPYMALTSRTAWLKYETDLKIYKSGGTFTGGVTFDGATTFNANATFQAGTVSFGAINVTAAGGGTVTLNGTNKIHTRENGWTSREHEDLDASDTTQTIDASFPLWVADGWHDASNLLTLTIADYTPVDDEQPEVEVLFFPTNVADQMKIDRASGGAPTIVTITAGGSVRLRWDIGASKWRLLSASSFDTTNGAISHGIY